MKRGRKRKQKFSYTDLLARVVKSKVDLQRYISERILKFKEPTLEFIRKFQGNFKKMIRKGRKKIVDSPSDFEKLLVKLHLLPLVEEFDDILNRKPYAKRIANEIISTHSKGKSSTLAISAKWGSGKTFVIELLKPFLKKENFKVIVFNPWYYSQEKISLKRAFLRDLKNGLGFWNKKFTNLDDLYSDSTTIKIRWGRLVSISVFLIFATILSALIYTKINSIGFNITLLVNTFINLGNLFSFLKTGQKDIPAIVTLILVPIVSFVVGGVFTIHYSTSAVTTSEKFREKFEGILGRNKKVVIIVDDLDRCSPEVVKEVLDALATFFVDKRCSFVITGDHTVVEKYVGSKLYVDPEVNETGEVDKKLTGIKEKAEGRRFLKKLFDVYWQIPRPEPVLFQKFIESEIKKQKIANLSDMENKQLISLLDEFLDRNLRAVIRFLSTLRFNLDTLSDVIKEKEKALKKTSALSKKLLESELKGLKEVTSNPVLLAKVLLIQELFYPMYEMLVKSPEALIMHEKEVGDGDIKHNTVSASKEIILHQPEEISLYSAILRKEPRFTDDDGTVLFSAENFLYLSGFTGLPSQKGPNDESFLNYLKGQVNLDKLIKSLEIASGEKRTSLKNIAQSALTSTAIVGDQKYGVISNVIEITKKFDEWNPIFDTLLEQIGKDEFLQGIEPARLGEIIKPFFSLCFQRGFGLDKVFSETPFNDAKYLELKWGAVNEISDGNLNEQASVKLLDLSMAEIISSESEVLNRVKLVSVKSNSSSPDVLNKLKEIYEFIVGQVFSKPIADRLSLINFLAEEDKNKDSSVSFTQKQLSLFQGANSLEEINFFLVNSVAIYKFLHVRFFNSLVEETVKFVEGRTNLDWKEVFDNLILKLRLSEEYKNRLVNAVFVNLRKDDEASFSYALNIIRSTNFESIFGTSVVLEKLVDSLVNINDERKAVLFSDITPILQRQPISLTERKILRNLTKNDNLEIAQKAKDSLKLPSKVAKNKKVV